MVEEIKIRFQIGQICYGWDNIFSVLIWANSVKSAVKSKREKWKLI